MSILQPSAPLHFWFELPICTWRILRNHWVQKFLWANRNMVLILNIVKSWAYLANSFFENCDFTLWPKILFTAIVVNSLQNLTLMTTGDLMETYHKWFLWEFSVLWLLFQPLDPYGPIWTFNLKFCTSLAPPGNVEFSAEMEVRNNSIHLSQAQIHVEIKSLKFADFFAKN